MTRGTHWLGARGRRILHTGAWSMIAKLTAAANLFLTVPFVLKALGPTQFGVWATLASLVTFAGFLDFGLGNGTMNLVAAAHGRGDHEKIATIVREGRRALILISLLLAVVAALAVPTIPWNRLLGVSANLADAARASVGVVFATILLAIPLNLATRVQLGLGQGNLAFQWQAIGQVLTTCIVIFLAEAGAGLGVLVAATVATPLLTLVANNLQLARVLRSYVKAAAVDPGVARAIRNEGMLFFILQLSAALAYSGDLPLISALCGPEEAGQYAIVQRLFSVVPMGLALMWTPLWPLYRQALAAGDHIWVQRTLRQSLTAAFAIACIGALALAIGFDWITRVWLKTSLHAGTYLVAGFAVWCIVDAVGTGVATFLNAASIMRYQVVVASLFAMATVAAKVAALRTGGITFLPWVTTMSYTAIFVVPTALCMKGFVRHSLARRY